jgi:hypothetical protein
MGDKQQERTDPMRSIRFTAVGIVVAAFAVAPASAATRHKQHAAPVQGESVDQGLLSAPVASRAMPAPNWLTPNACMSDEGFGRYSSCDSGTSN